jgi:hypothetical protein
MTEVPAGIMIVTAPGRSYGIRGYTENRQGDNNDRSCQYEPSDRSAWSMDNGQYDTPPWEWSMIDW